MDRPDAPYAGAGRTLWRGYLPGVANALATRSVEPAGRRGRRWLVASSVVLVIVVLSLLPPFLAGERGMLSRTVYTVLEAAVLVVALSLHHERAEERGRNMKRTLAESAAFAVVIGVLGIVLFAGISRQFGFVTDPRFEQVPLGGKMLFGFVSSLLQCSFWALGFVFPFAAEDARLRALEAETHRLEAEKLKLETEQLRSAAELARLRSQLEPHFLFNTLNAIAGLVTKHPKEARRLLGCLGDLLRESLRDPAEIHTVHDEVAWLQRYAEILESRHGDALRFEWDVEEEARPLLVPRLLLQPLVENAVDHGALQRPGDGRVKIEIALTNEQIVCTIEDNGPGLPAGPTRDGAFGLHSVRRRLELKFPTGPGLQLDSSDRGTRAVVRLPRPEAA